MTNGWSTGRPVYDRLPAKGYGDNDLADALTRYPDEVLTEVSTKLQDFYKQLDPNLASPGSLDYLAYLVGLSGDYWDTQWSTSVKRLMIAKAPYLWKTRGTLGNIRQVLDIHNLTYDIWTDGALRVPFKVGSKLGSSRLRFYVRVPLTYHRYGLEFRECDRTLTNYAPAIVKAKTVYKKFYVGFSRVGDPIFSK